ncbi:MAG: putative essential recombination function protein [Prokaryotic dsDNA virus sp.]|nr:MAG: putative essential recombination function protein [Prokaryotic dsDNA virus sp.]|tara:strand:- start:3848 stop:4393 length:546 start_codon:yes stop_codon:yes gene_type:complete
MKLNKVQSELKAPKGQTNKFGGYKYRSCEDILEAVKPLLGDSTLTITDDIVAVGDRIYVKATATFTDEDKQVISVSAFARESETKKGMDDSQITGSASSYARKYALNGLFLIDDTKDADTMDNREQPKKTKKLTLSNVSDRIEKAHSQGIDVDKIIAQFTKEYGELDKFNIDSIKAYYKGL